MKWLCRYCLRKPREGSLVCPKCCGYKRPPVIGVLTRRAGAR